MSSFAIMLFSLTLVRLYGDNMTVFLEFHWSSWVYLFIHSGGFILFQVLMAQGMRHGWEPGQMAQFQYLFGIYQIIYDVYIFNENYKFIQWIGFFCILAGYIWKFK